MIKAIFFDIDGTLVPARAGIIQPSAAEAIRQAREKGVKVFISSGRCLQWIDNLGDTEFDGYVTANGSLCLLQDKKTPVWRRTVDPSDIERLKAFSETTSMPIVAIPEHGRIISTRIDDDMRGALDELCISDFDIAPLSSVDPNVGIIQLMAFGPEEERRNSGLFGDVLRHCDVTSWNPHFCDIIPNGSDKGVGITKMAEHFGITIDETMAFGDGGNDIGMIKTAGIGVAMGNAAQTVKDAADYVTTDVDRDGVVNAFRHFGIL